MVSPRSTRRPAAAGARAVGRRPRGGCGSGTYPGLAAAPRRVAFARRPRSPTRRCDSACGSTARWSCSPSTISSSRSRSAPRSAAPAASCCARSRSSTSTGVSRSVRVQEPGPATRVPGRRPHAHRRRGRSPTGGDQAKPWRGSGARCVAETRLTAARRRARGTGARRRRLRLRRRARGAARLAPPAARARRGHLARRGRHAARRALSALPGAARADRARPRPADDVDAAIVAYPHGAAAPVVAELRGLGMLVVDLSADFRLRETCPPTSAGTATTARPTCSTAAVYGLPELYREQLREARAGRRRPAATRPPRPRARTAGRSAA